MSDKINGKTLEEIDEEVRDNMADADVGPLMEIIRGLQARVRKTHDLERAWGQERRGLMDRINELVERACKEEARVKELEAENRALMDDPDGDTARGIAARAMRREEAMEARMEAVQLAQPDQPRWKWWEDLREAGGVEALVNLEHNRGLIMTSFDAGWNALRAILATPTPGKGE